MEYHLVAEVTVSIYTVVEADSLEEAKQEAQGRSIEKGEWNSERQRKEVWVSDEYDSEPVNIQEA